MRHEWDAKWAPCPAPNKHLSVLTLNHKIYLFGYHLPVLDLEVIATQVGPGLVYLTFDSLLGRGCFTQTLTPVEPLLQVGHACSLHRCHGSLARFTVAAVHLLASPFAPTRSLASPFSTMHSLAPPLPRLIHSRPALLQPCRS